MEGCLILPFQGLLSFIPSDLFPRVFCNFGLRAQLQRSFTWVAAHQRSN